MAERVKKDKEWYLLANWAIVYVTVFLMFFSTAVSSLDPDLGWHLRVGKDTIQDGYFQSIEKYTYPTLGREWVDHEWLSNVILFEIYDIGGKYGYWILGVSFSLLMLLTIHLILKITRKSALPDADPWKFFFFGSVVMLMSAYALLTFFGIRLQTLSWFFVTIFFWLFLKIFKEKRYQLLWFFPLLSMLWANLHGSFIFGLAVFVSFCLFLLRFGKLNYSQKGLLVFSAIITFAATLATPYNFKLWALIVQEYTQNGYYLGKILEWLPLYTVPYIRWFITFYIAFFVAAFFIACKNKLLPRKIEVVLYLLFIFTTIIATISSRRFAPFFVLSSLPVIIYVFTKLFWDINVKKRVVGFSMSILVIVNIFQVSRISTLPLNPFDVSGLDVPHDATLFLKSQEKLHELKLFNNYELGGYLVWMWPEKKIFIDGRMPQKPLENGVTFLEEYFSFFKTDTVEKKLDQYNIELVLTSADRLFVFQSPLERLAYKHIFMVEEIDFQTKSPLSTYLESNWHKIYSDNYSIVYVRPSADATFEEKRQ